MRVLFVGWILVAFSASAADAKTNDYPFYSIDDSSITIEKVDQGVLSEDQIYNLIGDCSDLDQNAHPKSDAELGDLSRLINYGKEIWKVIENNKPVVNVTENTANALPKSFRCWTDLEQWQAPKYETYHVIYKNLFGMNVIDFRFQLIYSYGGKVQGMGSYLANVTVAPMNLDVLWGFEFDALVEVGQILNLGSHEDPIAGMEITMKWEAKSPVKDSRGQVRYFVQGDGTSQLFH